MYLKDFFKHKQIIEINQEKTSAQRLCLNIRVTAKSRFNASIRLRRQNKFAFFTTTTSSLGLIFIPLIQNTQINFSTHDSELLNIMSIFFAIVVLIYSVVIGTAKYEMRSEALNQCGIKLNNLSKKLIDEINAYDDKNIPLERLKKFHKKYQQIILQSENHEYNDYIKALLEMRWDYKIEGWEKYKKIFYNWIKLVTRYITPVIILVSELVFIIAVTNKIGLTSIPIPFLKIFN